MAIQKETLGFSDRVRVNGVSTEANITGDGRITWREGGEERYLSAEAEVLGFGREGSMVRVRGFVKKRRGGKRVRRDLVFEPSTVESMGLWCEKLRVCIDSLGRPKRLFIIVNPYGGKKCARKIFHNEVKPLLVAADIQFTLQETEYQLHAKEIAISLDILKYDGIICVSGDGVLVEVVNGLLQREDWATAIKLPLGIVPAGTGNGMAKSLLDEVNDSCSVSNAVFAIIRGHKRPLDVATVLQDRIRFFSVLMLTWGLVADIDIESEKYRWMGSARLDFYCLMRLVNLRRYLGQVSFVPAPGYETFGQPILQNGNCNCDLETQDQGHLDKIVQDGYQGPSTSFETHEWRSIDGPFISVWLHNVPWASADIMPAPAAKFADGYLDLVIIRDCPRALLISLLMKFSDGTHVKSPYVMYLKVKAFRLEPGSRAGNPKKGGIIDSDGEVIARGKGTYNCQQKTTLHLS
ncbi:Sphingosine kinase 2 [Acorus gramineus]|uniref:sphingosine kinase n=1 Tax=Acorus gramineus TaxID=55184 RepID=A0AAV9A9T9_ACOGR|nr:Sphingosine kinase 2 [Acorus gramineus]